VTRRARAERSERALPTDLALVGLLCACKLAIDACVLRLGFTHVSDDDYARTVISQQFAHAPRLDPSGTSWLPLPFWIAGAAMRALGRSLGAARAISVTLGAAGVVAPYAAMRSLRLPRATALAATLVGMALPWNAWLGAATVPDGWTAALIAAGAIAMREEAARPWCAVALLAASLARYEAWAACAALALVCGVHALQNRGDRSARDLACALLALAGPALWMAWNAHAHGSPFHFIARVTAFRRAIGAADAPLRDKLLGYPRALVADVPEAAALGACGLAGLCASRGFRERWGAAAAVALAVLAFLVVGDLGDGAPTHHPARALGAVVWILVAMGVDAVAGAIARPPARLSQRAAAIAAAGVALAWVGGLPDRWDAAPGESDAERRDTQIARGLELRRLETERAEITPCQFEHFALIAAWGEPERARVNARTSAPVTDGCPEVTLR
jgi:hypothetical protein